MLTVAPCCSFLDDSLRASRVILPHPAAVVSLLLTLRWSWFAGGDAVATQKWLDTAGGQRTKPQNVWTQKPPAAPSQWSNGSAADKDRAVKNSWSKPWMQSQRRDEVQAMCLLFGSLKTLVAVHYDERRRHGSAWYWQLVELSALPFTMCWLVVPNIDWVILMQVYRIPIVALHSERCQVNESTHQMHYWSLFRIFFASCQGLV